MALIATSGRAGAAMLPARRGPAAASASGLAAVDVLASTTCHGCVRLPVGPPVDHPRSCGGANTPRLPRDPARARASAPVGGGPGLRAAYCSCSWRRPGGRAFASERAHSGTSSRFSSSCCKSGLLYMLTALIFPDVGSRGTVDLVEHFERHRRAFFAFLIAMLVISIAKDFVLDGRLPSPHESRLPSLPDRGRDRRKSSHGARRLQLGLALSAVAGFVLYVTFLFARLARLGQIVPAPLLLLGTAGSGPLLESPGSSVIASAVLWLQGTLLGSLASTIAVIAIASVGLMMLSGRVNIRYGLTVILGCFILFGASTIAAGIMASVSGADRVARSERRPRRRRWWRRRPRRPRLPIATPMPAPPCLRADRPKGWICPQAAVYQGPHRDRGRLMTARLMSGFGSHFASEAVAGALPEGRNSPQRPAFGLYAEQLSGTAFTAPRAENRRSWLYRMRPSAAHPPYRRYAGAALVRAGHGRGAARRPIACAGTRSLSRTRRPISSTGSSR